MYLIVENEKDITTSSPYPSNGEHVKSIKVSDDIYYDWCSHREKYYYADGEILVDPDYEEKEAAKREAKFKEDFFHTSLGWIRRVVSMKVGGSKNFLTDLLPAISLGVDKGQTVNIITYNEPDFTQEEVDWESLQVVKQVTPQFIQECLLQVSLDFTGV